MWRLPHRLFIHDGTHVLQGGMSTGPIVKGFNVVEGCTPGLCSRLKCFRVNAFTLKAVKKTLCDSIIVTIGSAAHAHLHVIVLDKCDIAF